MSVATAHVVCRAADVPLGEGRAVTVAGRRIAVFNAPTGWFALDAACPHQGGPLADGIVADNCVACPLHDRRFDLRTGECLGGGESVASHRVEVREGAVEVTLT
ncbi:MAG TPA: nitrite reductase small subunit NirD [Solirubrobacterales bacterium]|nr:nitrite reductase small subunit NirD [Solirubrobacterales bacterium]